LVLVCILLPGGEGSVSSALRLVATTACRLPRPCVLACLGPGADLTYARHSLGEPCEIVCFFRFERIWLANAVGHPYEETGEMTKVKGVPGTTQALTLTQGPFVYPAPRSESGMMRSQSAGSPALLTCAPTNYR